MCCGSDHLLRVSLNAKKFVLIGHTFTALYLVANSHSNLDVVGGWPETLKMRFLF